MDFKELLTKLGIEEHPEFLEEAYNDKSCRSNTVCDAGFIKKYEEEYAAFGEHIDDVLAAAEDLEKNEALLEYAKTVGAYLLLHAKDGASTAVPFPAEDGTPALNMIRLLVLLPLIPHCIAEYEAHGFEKEEIAKYIGVFKTSLSISKIRSGYPCFMNAYYAWMLHYLHCEIFDFGSFNFQFTTYRGAAIMLRNKRDGSYKLLMTAGRFHKSGRILGSDGCLDEDGAFDADFYEDDECYCGISTERSRAVNKRVALKKSEWECVLRAGDEAIGLHIPKKADLSSEAILSSYKGGWERAKRIFPEYTPKFIICGSWLLDEQIEDMTGENSKLAYFAKTFLRYPIKSKGRNGFSNVFPGHRGPESELPEDTTLQRKIKATYLAGGHTWGAGGIVPMTFEN